MANRTRVTKKAARSSAKTKVESALAASGPLCSGGVCDPERTQGLLVSPSRSKHVLVNLQGPGTFLSAMVTKQGGDSGITFVNLDIDGRNVVSMSFAGLQNFGLTAQNPHGVVLRGTGGPVQSVTIGWPYPLVFKKSLSLRIQVKETGVAQIIGLVVHGSAPSSA